MKIYLQTIPGVGGPYLRFYQLSLQKDIFDGWTLIKENGIQGRAGRINKQHYNTWEEAQSAMLTARDNQLRRGYKVVFINGDKQPDMDTP
ncbi:MAG: hypothetical protein ACC707_12495 [Thiohalomonadales bacterium]